MFLKLSLMQQRWFLPHCFFCLLRALARVGNPCMVASFPQQAASCCCWSKKQYGKTITLLPLNTRFSKAFTFISR
jgi:hypothetical protein